MARTARQYYSYQDAKAFMQRLGISSRSEYREYTRNPDADPLIPTDPQRTYAAEWEGWPGFCAKSQYHEKYSTYEQASAAAQRLGVRSKQEYQKRYVEDPALPIAPERVYAADWTSWTRFLGGVDPYPTLEEATQAARKLKCKTKRDYDVKRTEDPRLPASPDRMYEGWPGWAVFLGKL